MWCSHDFRDGAQLCTGSTMGAELAEPVLLPFVPQLQQGLMALEATTTVIRLTRSFRGCRPQIQQWRPVASGLLFLWRVAGLLLPERTALWGIPMHLYHATARTLRCL
jgi:hypothetical protein